MLFSISFVRVAFFAALTMAAVAPDPSLVTQSNSATTDENGAAPSLLVQPLTARQRSCPEASDCQTCIATENCAWCMPDEENMEHSSASCMKVTPDGEGQSNTNCKGTLYDPRPSVDDSTSGFGPTDSALVITPSKVHVKLRVGEVVSVPLELAVSKNQLLDLYYLTDISKSMGDDLKLLENIASSIEQELEAMTSKSNIGFGTFIDKKMFPYWDPYNTFENKDPSNPCHATYGFCNALPLYQTGGEDFSNAVKGTGVASNKDTPEGGLEALLQVLVCKEEIKWREKALKIVLYTSDSSFHYAGDAKLAGIDLTNDGMCHLNSTGNWYTHSKLQDYPSIYQIGNAAKENHINVIFGVTKEVIPLYQKLQSHIPDSFVAEISDNSENIIKVIQESLQNITNSLNLVSKSSNLVDISVLYECSDNVTETCSGLEVGHTYKMTANLKLKRCPATGALREEARISSTNLVEDIVLDIEYICSCDCMQATEVSSSVCSGGLGNYTCGQCSCDEGSYGSICQCQGSSDVSDLEKCMLPPSVKICEDHGECSCGKCECEEGYYGEHCECHDSGCPVANGVECGGNGGCSCYQCQCREGWSGDSCICSTNTDNCLKPDSAQLRVCSGNGDCECNSCVCGLTGRNDNEHYFGKWCHDCPSCGGECIALSDCVRCHLLSTGDSKVTSVNTESCGMQACTTDITITQVSAVEAEVLSFCSIKESDCVRQFSYLRNNNGTAVYISNEWQCPVKLWVIIVSVAASIFIFGLIIVFIIKCFNDYKAKKEAKAMIAERDQAMENMNATHLNDLYKNPVSNMQNPMFGRDL